MIRLAISVEGPTEERFIESILVDHLAQSEIIAVPILLGRARSNRAGGGNVRIERLGTDMARCYHNFDFVTSLVDFYGFKDKGHRTVGQLEQDILHEVRRRVSRRLDERKILPYIQMYEFEGLLFSDVAAFGNALGATSQIVEQLTTVRSQFPTPEDINDSPTTAPGKRIAQAIAGYDKVVAGSLVSLETGLDTIRAQCPRFNAWLATLESLSE